MDKWNTDHHNSGLVQKVKDSNITESIAENKQFNFYQNMYQRDCTLCGNTICQDRRF